MEDLYSAPPKQRADAAGNAPAPLTANNIVSILFILTALVVFPLWFGKNYDTLAQAKLDFFVPAVVIFLIFSAVVLLGRVLVHPRRVLRRPEAFTLSDAMMLLFFAAAVVSWQCSPWPEEAYWGSDYRHHGLVIIAMYTLVYFLLSRFARRLSWVPAAFLFGALPVFWFGLQNFLGKDLLGLYAKSSAHFIDTCISTIGNWNFYAGFVCMYLAVMSSMLLKSRKILLTVLYGFGVFAGSAALICSSSDSGFAGLAVLLVILPFFIGNWRQLAHYAMLPALLFLAGKAMHFAVQSNHGVTKIPLRGFSKMLMESIAGWVFLAVCAGIVVFCLILHKIRPNASFPAALKVIWGFVLAGCVLAVLLAIVYFSAVNTAVPLGKLEKYLRFNDSWGSTRGFAWIRALREYSGYDTLQKLFGTGADTAKHLYMPKYYTAMMKLGNAIFENVHNEYLQYLVTLGAVGATAYIALIASVVTRSFRRAGRSKLALALGLAVLCYAVQGIFNITQTMTTPVFFTLLALAEACCRETDAAARLQQPGASSAQMPEVSDIMQASGHSV
ncbi:MAG: O-antigen ligase family protein [Firmicutes bacterium]|nr:O-antigen ligase family protein [Bacillota bacterium]